MIDIFIHVENIKYFYNASKKLQKSYILNQYVLY
jgi:hypothetical protein